MHFAAKILSSVDGMEVQPTNSVLLAAILLGALMKERASESMGGRIQALLRQHYATRNDPWFNVRGEGIGKCL